MYTQASIQDIADTFGISTCAATNRLRHVTKIRSLSEANRVRYRKNVVTLTPAQEQLVYGSLLGDACLCRQQKSTHFYLKILFAHGQDQLAYLQHKHLVMGGCKISQRPEGSNLGKPVYQFAYTNTQGLLPVEAVVKADGIKRVSDEWLRKLELPGIAYWYQDDGSLIKPHGKIGHIRWYTNAFSAEEISRLVLLLRTFGFSSVGTVTGNKKPEQRVITCFGYQAIVSFLKKLKPYIVPCLAYKCPV